MKVFLGLDGKIYRNTGTHGSPVWEELENVKDLTLTIEASEADVTTRAGGGTEQVVSALKKASVEFQMRYDTTDPHWVALKDAFFGPSTGNAIEFAVMDGDINVTGAEGLRATMTVLKFSRTENLEEHMMTDVAIKPTVSDHAPAWYKVA